MSEGTFFHCSTPNLTVYIGSYIIRFRDGLYPKKGIPTTDEDIINAIKSHPDYGRTIESDEDRQKRLTPDPKVAEDLKRKALEALKHIPGVVPSELTLSKPPEDPQEPESQKPESEPLEQAPSLTEASRWNKKTLLEFCELYDIEVTEGDTVAILRRKVKSWIKQNT